MRRRLDAATTADCAAVVPSSPAPGHFSVAARAMPRRIESRIFELTVRTNGAQHEPSARHIAEAGEGGREAKAGFEDGQKDVDVLAAGDAAKKDHLGVIFEGGRERERIALQRLSVVL